MWRDRVHCVVPGVAILARCTNVRYYLLDDVIRANEDDDDDNDHNDDY